MGLSLSSSGANQLTNIVCFVLQILFNLIEKRVLDRRIFFSILFLQEKFFSGIFFVTIYEENNLGGGRWQVAG